MGLFDRVRGCREDADTFAQGHFEFVQPRFDDLVVNGHRLAFELSDCAPRRASDYYDDPHLVRPFAARFAKSAVVSPPKASVPASLTLDMAKGTLATDIFTGNHLSYISGPYEDIPAHVVTLYPGKAWVPRCILGDYGSHCIVLLADLDHDGQAEVVVIDSGLITDQTDFHDVTLLHFDRQHWHVVAHGQLCSEWGNEPSQMTYASARPLWQNLSVDAKRIAVGGERCQVRREILY